MADQENNSRIMTRNAKKRALEAIHSQSQPMKKTRVVLVDSINIRAGNPKEVKRRPMADYIEKVQKDVTVNMSVILVDWLVEVAEEYKLLPYSLYLTISYIDRKYEEITPPQTEDFCYITDNTYTKQEVVKMEADVLKALHFEMGNPTVKSFLRISAMEQLWGYIRL
ncbi:G2/mitotic-specific cyclin C13-1-like protein [Tanacetum coccineum]